MKIGLVIPHIFMHRDILPQVIFSPGELALQLASGMTELGHEVTLFSPGPVDTPARNVSADMRLFENELAGRGDSYLDLLKKHPFTFITLARQVQSELVAQAYAMANDGRLDIVHVYTNEEDIALPFAGLCRKPVVFTHHDPFNFLVKYKNVFPKYGQLNWLSISYAQRQGMPADTNWLANIYHGVDTEANSPVEQPASDYVVCLGRIIEAKGTHLALDAVQRYNQDNPSRELRLKIVGKHYSGKKDAYWQQCIQPQLDGEIISYEGYIGSPAAKRQLLANARALIIPSTFQEPFGMVITEALACGTPVVGLASGATPEIIKHGQTGLIAQPASEESQTVQRLAEALAGINAIDRQRCRQDCLERFTLQRMTTEHATAYSQLV